MKKFKEFYKAVADPKTPEDWVEVLFMTPELEPVSHDYAAVRTPALYHMMLSHMHHSPDFLEMRIRQGYKFLHTQTGRKVVLTLGNPPYVTILYWYKR